MALPHFPIVIAETSGRFRPIILTGTTMPREGNETPFGIETRGKTTWNPGSSSATSQILGHSFEPIEFQGILEDRRIGAPGAAVALAFYIEQIVKGGREVLFNYGPYVRRCRWLRARFTTIELQRIRYEIELQPIDDGLRDRSRVKPGLRNAPSVEKTVEATSDLQIDLEAVDANGNPRLADAEVEVQKVLTLTIEGGEHLEGVGTPGSLVDTDASRAALNKFDQARTSLGNAQRIASEVSWAGTATPDFEAVTGDGWRLLELQHGFNTAARELQSLREATARLAGEPLSGVIYIAAAGDTLQGIASRFYGTPERWHEILEANGKASPVVTSGEQLLLRDVPGVDVATVPG